jgi:enamine deaminase RidA (YjgF/YER057c/UK114 family)
VSGVDVTIKAITPAHFPWLDYTHHSFSLGVEAGSRAFLSGHSASEFDASSRGMVVLGDMEAQARTSYAKIDTILAEAGFGMGDVSRVIEYVTAAGIDEYAAAERVRGEVFGSHTPAVNVVAVHQLLSAGSLIEVEVTADRDTSTQGANASGRPGYASGRVAGGLLYLSTIHPYDEDGELVGEGDVEEQARQIFRNAQRLLASYGLSMANVVNSLDMVRPEARRDYKYTGRVRREFLGPVYPAAAGLLQSRVAADDRVLVSYDFIASTHDPVAVNPGLERYEKLTYSPAVRAGDFVFLSGQAALDPETEQAVHAGDIVAQTDYIYRNLIDVLEAAGLGPEHFVKTVEFVTPRGYADYRATASVRRELLREPFPASTGVLCAELLRPEFDIEIVAVAMFPDVA